MQSECSQTHSGFFYSNLHKRPHTLHPFGKSIQVLLYAFCPLSSIILDGIHENVKDLGSRYFGHLANTSRRDVVDNFKITSYNVANRIIYEWGTCTCAIRRFRFEIINIEIMQHVFVIKYLCCHRYGISIRDYRYGLILKIWWHFRVD